MAALTKVQIEALRDNMSPEQIKQLEDAVKVELTEGVLVGLKSELKDEVVDGLKAELKDEVVDGLKAELKAAHEAPRKNRAGEPQVVRAKVEAPECLGDFDKLQKAKSKKCITCGFFAECSVK